MLTFHVKRCGNEALSFIRLLIIWSVCLWPRPLSCRPIRRSLRETSTWPAPALGELCSWLCCQSPLGQVSMWAWPLHSSPTSPRTNTGEEENYPSTPLFYTLLAKDLRDEVFRGTVDTPPTNAWNQSEPRMCLKKLWNRTTNRTRWSWRFNGEQRWEFEFNLREPFHSLFDSKGAQKSSSYVWGC